jgi:hypothetical protein
MLYTHEVKRELTSKQKELRTMYYDILELVTSMKTKNDRFMLHGNLPNWKELSTEEIYGDTMVFVRAGRTYLSGNKIRCVTLTKGMLDLILYYNKNIPTWTKKQHQIAIYGSMKNKDRNIVRLNASGVKYQVNNEIILPPSKYTLCSLDLEVNKLKKDMDKYLEILANFEFNGIVWSTKSKERPLSFFVETEMMTENYKLDEMLEMPKELVEYLEPVK